MREVIAKLTQVEQQLEAKIQMTQDKIQMTQEKIQVTQDKVSNEIKIVYWVVGIAMAVILFVVARK